ncbi:hypothetical protein FEE95_06325 [Maribacter algarum]|uniref:Uncharacterized protein n=1 Tax=Maribacter algarum (ex Zhang et al. 2020) TaxID=2578118 RepID=A0A5S3PVK9_9FLAO|nr:hypothetical protein [Maribacter algarum]TMM59046.1 hypothetical protein FEE95_06325 [Maribacter algarum]
MSLFIGDLAKEKLLASFLDAKYIELQLKFERIHELKLKKKGVDLVYKHKGKRFYIDEKAQLYYPNVILPTFTFELSYLKKGIEKEGWLLDENKITTHYFLVIGIYTVHPTDFEQGFTNAKIISVNRNKLLAFLDSIGLSLPKLKTYNQELRNQRECPQKVAINELFIKTQGCLFYSKQLEEEPINLQLRIEFLIKSGIGKVIYPTKKIG